MPAAEEATGDCFLGTSPRTRQIRVEVDELNETLIFNVTQPYAFRCFVVTASRCEVAAHAATFCSLVEKTP